MEAEARYRIRAVSQMTGVPAATLRAWERRYGLPIPHRSASAYRLYTERDVEQVRNMSAQVARGVPPSEAARRLLDTPRPAVDPREEPHQAVANRIVLAARQLDGAALQTELQRVMLLGDAKGAFERILTPALVEIGRLWEVGEISIANEHFATHLIAAAAQDLLRTVVLPAEAPVALLACFAEEQHLLPLLGAALTIASWGFRPVLLGTRTPPGALARAVERLAPAFVGLSATLVPEPAVARELVDGYADACGQTPWFVGGSAAAALTTFISARGGYVLSKDELEARLQIARAVAPRKRRKSPEAPKKTAAPKDRRTS